MPFYKKKYHFKVDKAPKGLIFRDNIKLIMKNQTAIPFSGGCGEPLSSLAIGACLLLGQALGQAQVAKVGQVAEDFEITNRETGEPLRLSDFEGHVIVLDFFAWWCGPCRALISYCREGYLSIF